MPVIITARSEEESKHFLGRNKKEGNKSDLLIEQEIVFPVFTYE